jgi:hypothetical protein
LSKHKTLKVEIYEVHRDALPRKYGAHSRQIYPYHHSRALSSELNDDLRYSCPVRSGSLEIGGIPQIFDWIPGPVEAIIDDLKQKFKTAMASYGVDRMEFFPRSKLTNIDPGKILVQTTFSVIDGQSKPDKPSPQFNAVVLALGGQRLQQDVMGLPPKDYWLPINFENSLPQYDPYRVLIIGSGNSAASEVFNFLFPDKNFAKFKRELQTELGLSEIKRLNAEALDFQTFRSWANKNDNISKIQYAVSNMAPYTSDELQINILVRDRCPALIENFRYRDNIHGSVKMAKDMNAINSFLIHCLWATDHVKFWSMSQNKTDKYEVEATKYGKKVLFGGAEIDLAGEYWDQVIDCQPPQRQYQEYFKVDTRPKIWRNGTRASLHAQILEKQNALGLATRF